MTPSADEIAARPAVWRALKAERKARLARLQAEEDAAAKAEGREPLPVLRKERDIELGRRRRRRIVAALFQGQSKVDIAAAEGCSMRRLNRMLHEHGIDVPRHPGCRAIPVQLYGGRAAWLDRLAAKAEITPGAMAARLLSVMLEDPARATRMLGKMALPRRRKARHASSSYSV
jgi:hypothetical protein